MEPWLHAAADASVAVASGHRLVRCRDSTRGPSGYGGGYGGGGYGGGFGFPFLLPFFGFGGGTGGLFGIFIAIAVANFLIRSFRSAGVGDDGTSPYSDNPAVSVARLQVGLLAQARGLQADLNQMPKLPTRVAQPGSPRYCKRPRYRCCGTLSTGPMPMPSLTRPG